MILFIFLVGLYKLYTGWTQVLDAHSPCSTHQWGRSTATWHIILKESKWVSVFCNIKIIMELVIAMFKLVWFFWNRSTKTGFFFNSCLKIGCKLAKIGKGAPFTWTTSRSLPTRRMGRDTNFNSNVSLFGGNQSINWLYQPGIDIRPCGSLWFVWQSKSNNERRQSLKWERWNGWKNIAGIQALHMETNIATFRNHDIIASCKGSPVSACSQHLHSSPSISEIMNCRMLHCPNYWLQVVLAPPLYFFYTMSLPEAG